MDYLTPTPPPWTVDARGYIRGPGGENILKKRANAEFVCRVMNSYEEIKMALMRYGAHNNSCDVVNPATELAFAIYASKGRYVCSCGLGRAQAIAKAAGRES